MMQKFLSRVARVALLAVVAVSISACGSSTGEQSDDNLQVQEQGSQTTLRTTGSTGETDRNGEASVAVEDTTAEPVEVEASVIASNLEAPWGLAFLPDGRALVGERDTGQLLAVDDSGDIEEVQQLPESGSGEGGSARPRTLSELRARRLPLRLLLDRERKSGGPLPAWRRTGAHTLPASR